MENRTLNERKAFSEYLSGRQVPIELITGEIGSGTLDTLLMGLTVMDEQIEAAAEAAKNGDTQGVGYILGAGAKITKDEIYIVLIEAYGGLKHFIDRGTEGVPSIIKDYTMAKYDNGVKRCEMLLSAR
jgi:hypothetical protein